MYKEKEVINADSNLHYHYLLPENTAPRPLVHAGNEN